MNAYSRRFAERLFAAHPEWRALAAPDPAGDPPPGSLIVNVQSPAAARELAVRTYGEQVTVEFGAQGWHEHFGAWSGRTEEAIFDAALAFVADLLADRVGAAPGTSRWVPSHPGASARQSTCCPEDRCMTLAEGSSPAAGGHATL